MSVSVYRLRRRWRDGATHMVFEPIELPERLDALVPPPRFHRVRYHGILASAGGRRDAVVPARIAASCRIDTSDVMGACEIASEEDETLEDATDQNPDRPPVGPTPHATPSPSVHPRGDIEAYRNPVSDQTQPDNRLEASAVGTPPDPPHPASVSPSYPRRLPWVQTLARVFAAHALRFP